MAVARFGRASTSPREDWWHKYQSILKDDKAALAELRGGAPHCEDLSTSRSPAGSAELGSGRQYPHRTGRAAAEVVKTPPKVPTPRPHHVNQMAARCKLTRKNIELTPIEARAFKELRQTRETAEGALRLQPLRWESFERQPKF
eukprot:TRINITY_DN87220_c0_g1_i1.p1 TRINITY_DN87220_c0_g1~~TRINITY_DN87220_c0_g1_i1.p1  ORF type:complete len:144 (-),score=24.91 TRINITY_DN87220_c0_g1_i1:306-737(-)